MNRRVFRTRIILAAAIFFGFAGIPSRAAAEPPARIVSLAPSCAEIIAALGLQDRLVGISEYTDYPPEARHLPQVGSYVSPHLESIVSLKPDLVVATDDGNPPDILARIRNLGIPLIVLNLRTFEKIQQSILLLGEALARRNEAKATVDEMRRVAACVSEATRKRARPSVLFVYDSYPFVTPGGGTFTDELISMAGGISITHDVNISYPNLTIETVIVRNPEVVIVSGMNPAMDRQRELRRWQQWPGIAAVQSSRVHVIDSRNLNRPSQRVVFGLVLLARTLHPESLSATDCIDD